jgi:hypothetical protein
MVRPLGLAIDQVVAASTLGAGWLLTSTTCAAANPAGCTFAICAVAEGATYFRNVRCTPCPAPPTNGFYDTESMGGTLALECRPRCTTGFYYNSSDRRCGECAALDRNLCLNSSSAAGGWHVRGGGCYGDDMPFSDPTDLTYLRNHNCVQCALPLPPAGAPRFLDTGNPEGCAYKNCSAISIVEAKLGYVVTLCGGTSDYVTAPCLTGCADGFYLKGKCTPTASGVCTPCTVLNPRYYLTGVCGLAADSVWQACGVPPGGGAFVPGFYCPGTYDHGTPMMMRMKPCPNHMTSLALAWDVGAHCFCPAGTQVQQSDPLQRSCVPMRCPDATPHTSSAPGGGWRSASYMTIDTANLISVCRPCSRSPVPDGYSAAFTLGDGLESVACRCAPGSCLVTDESSSGGGGGLSLSWLCAPCPPSSSPDSNAACARSGGAYNTVPDTCWSGRQVGAAACLCVMPPFATTPTTIGGGAWCGPTPTMCAPGFLQANDLPADGGPPPREPATGSPLHITRPTSVAGWTQLLATAPSNGGGAYETYALSHLAVTSDYADWGDTFNLQYALWLIADPASANVYAVSLPPTAPPSGYDPYTSTDLWTVVSDTASDFTVEALAVAQWPVPQTPGRLFPGSGGVRRSAYTDAAVAVLDRTNCRLWLHLNTFSVGSSGVIAWASPTTARARVSLSPPREPMPGGEPEPVEPVAMAHAYTAPTTTPYNPNNVEHVAALLARSTFFVAYNRPAPYAPEIVAVSVRNGEPTRTAVLPTSRMIGAMAVLALPDGGGVYLYLSLRTAPHVQRIRWDMTQTQTLLPAGVDELFFPLHLGTVVVRSLSVLWPATALTPIFVALVVDPVTDVASAQPILYARQGPPCTLHAADLVQRTFVPLQGMPSPTHLTTAALTGTNLAAALLVASDETSGVVFGLPAARCGTDTPSYWDGTRCIPHACVRARQCAAGQGQVWDTRQLRCACAAGFFDAPGSKVGVPVCQACPPGFVCGGNGTRVPCPFQMTMGPVGATVASDCFCREGYYFTGAACAPCPMGSWCPNQWDVRTCPGTPDPIQSTGGNVFPTACACAEGSVGALCAACPSNYYCPTSSVFTVKNSAVRVGIAATITTADAAAADALEERGVCTALTALLATYFRTSSPWYLRDPAALTQRVYCAFVPAPPGRTAISPMAYLMVQTDPADANSVKDMPAALLLQRNATAAAARFVLTGVFPTSDPITWSVRNNTALLCPPGKTPSATLTGCVCAPGYELLASACKACPSGQYKPASGAGGCLVCPLGTTSSAGAPACAGAAAKDTGNGTNTGADGNTDASQTPLNLPLIVGGVAGGVVVSCCLVYAIVAFA